MFKKFRKNEKGFTLAELLIVVAIIGVLVAISIPIFTSQLEKSREAVDMANIRAAYAEVMAEALADPDTDYSESITTKQTTAGWVSAPEIAGVTMTDAEAPAQGDVTIAYTAKDGIVKIGTVTISGKVGK